MRQLHPRPQRHLHEVRHVREHDGVQLTGDTLMKEEVRRAIAHAASAKVNGAARSSVYSYEAGAYTQMGGSGPGGYDYDIGAHISASGSGLYHYGTGAHITLNANGDQFSGYDYDSGQHFSGRVSGNTVQLYDYGDGRYFSYTA
jgi:hypothetical protein